VIFDQNSLIFKKISSIITENEKFLAILGKRECNE